MPYKPVVLLINETGPDYPESPLADAVHEIRKYGFDEALQEFGNEPALKSDIDVVILDQYHYLFAELFARRGFVGQIVAAASDAREQEKLMAWGAHHQVTGKADLWDTVRTVLDAQATERQPVKEPAPEIAPRTPRRGNLPEPNG